VTARIQWHCDDYWGSEGARFAAYMMTPAGVVLTDVSTSLRCIADVGHVEVALTPSADSPTGDFLLVVTYKGVMLDGAPAPLAIATGGTCATDSQCRAAGDAEATCAGDPPRRACACSRGYAGTMCSLGMWSFTSDMNLPPGAAGFFYCMDVL